MECFFDDKGKTIWFSGENPKLNLDSLNNYVQMKNKLN